METQITLLTREMLTDYRTYSGKNIESPEDYMIFRKQAIMELNLDVKEDLIDITDNLLKENTVTTVTEPNIEPKIKEQRQTEIHREAKEIVKQADEFNPPKSKPSELPPQGSFFNVIKNIDG